MKKKLTFEQQLTLRRFYQLRNKERIKSINKFINNVEKGIKTLIPTIYLILNILFIALICSLVGSGSQTVIYHLNKPVGMGYAYYASYAIAGLIGIILFNNLKEVKDGHR